MRSGAATWVPRLPASVPIAAAGCYHRRRTRPVQVACRARHVPFLHDMLASPLTQHLLTHHARSVCSRRRFAAYYSFPHSRAMYRGLAPSSPPMCSTWQRKLAGRTFAGLSFRPQRCFIAHSQCSGKRAASEYEVSGLWDGKCSDRSFCKDDMKTHLCAASGIVNGEGPVLPARARRAASPAYLRSRR